MAGTCDVKAEALIGAEHRVRTSDLRLGRRNALPVSHETGRKRQLGSGGPFQAGEYERLDVGSSYPDSVEHTCVSQFAALAEPIDRLGGYVEECSDVTNRQQRPQPVRRILGERCENLRSPGIRGSCWLQIQSAGGASGAPPRQATRR